MHPLITILNRDIPTYGLMAGLGALVMGWVVYRLAERRGLVGDRALEVGLFAVLGVVVGGSLLYGLTNLPALTRIAATWEAYPSLMAAVIDVARCFAGAVFYGGLFGGMAVAYLVMRRKGLDVAAYADVFAVGIPLFHAFGRIGCFLGGCCYGVECSVGPVFSDSLAPGANGVPRFPVQLLEAGLDLALFALLAFLFRKGRMRGRLLPLYLGSYAVIRFFDEFLRGDIYRGFIMGLSTSQVISLVVLAAALGALLVANARLRAEGAEAGGGNGRFLSSQTPREDSERSTE